MLASTWSTTARRASSSYATYVTERLTGFGGEGEPLRPADYDDFPEWAERTMSARARAAG